MRCGILKPNDISHFAKNLLEKNKKQTEINSKTCQDIISITLKDATYEEREERGYGSELAGKKYCVTDDGHTLSPNRRFPGSLQEGTMGRLQEITGQMKVNNWTGTLLLMPSDKSGKNIVQTCQKKMSR